MTNSKSYLTSWSSEPANCWSYVGTSKAVSPSRTALWVSSSTGSTRPSTSASPYRTDTHSRPTGCSVSPTDKLPPYPKSTPQTKSLMWGTFLSNPLMTTTTRSPSCPCPAGSTMRLPDQPQGVAPYSLANQHLTWGIAAELYRYRQAHVDVIFTENQIESLKAQVRCCKEVQAGARSRMEIVTAGVRRDTSSVKVFARKAVARLPLMGFLWV